MKSGIALKVRTYTGHGKLALNGTRDNGLNETKQQSIQVSYCDYACCGKSMI